MQSLAALHSFAADASDPAQMSLTAGEELNEVMVNFHRFACGDRVLGPSLAHPENHLVKIYSPGYIEQCTAGPSS